MLKKITHIFLLLAMLTFSSNIFAQVPIIFSHSQHSLSNSNERADNALIIEALHHQHININQGSPYSAILATVIHANHPYIILHLLSKLYFSAHNIRINLTKTHQIQYPIVLHYKMTAADFERQNTQLGVTQPQCPAEYENKGPLFVIGSPFNNLFANIPKAVQTLTKEINQTHQYYLVTLLNNDATVQNYENIMMCPNLKYFFNIGHSDEDMTSIVLSDGDLEANFFQKQSALDLHKTGIIYDSCLLDDNTPHGFCPIFNAMPKKPAFYSSGSTELLIFGSVETYACFWKHVLAGEPASTNILNQCAQQYDPSVKGSHAGIDIISDLEHASTIVTTNQRTITISPSKVYTHFNLQPGEKVTSYAVKNLTSGASLQCKPYDKNVSQLIGNTSLTHAEFETLYDSNDNTCTYTDIEHIVRDGNFMRDIYGLQPTQSCFDMPNVPPLGNFIIEEKNNPSLGSSLSLTCNGISQGNLPLAYTWPLLIDNMNGAHQLQCTIHNKQMKPLLDFSLSIQPSTLYKHYLAAKLSNVHATNGEPMPDVLNSRQPTTNNPYVEGIELDLKQ